MKAKTGVADVFIWIILALAALSCLVPMLNSLAISFSDKTSAALGKVLFWPHNFNISSYIKIVEEQQFFRSFANSLLRVFLGGLLNISLCIIMAYPLSKEESAFRFRNVYIWVIVFTMLFNGGLVPTFLVIKSLGLMDTIWALVLPGSVPVFSLILLMNFYKGLPKALEEAARVDGANPLFILFNIFVPLSKPAIATIALFSIVGHWNAFFDGKIYMNTPLKMPLQTYIQSLTVQVDFTRLSTMTREQVLEQLERSNLTFNSAKVMVSMVPILLIYPFLQRYFVTGIVMGAVKE
ncbi:MAG: carbohydrate ABC transporter permease [Clostridiales bacterium]|jgi:ABC-type glycerol-3-phosphate transport system permease component|nr:carbohydrate ABC transporter permease [Clostridiales bacterium]